MAQRIEKIPANSRFARKNVVTMTGIFSGRRAGSRRSAMLIGSSSKRNCPPASTPSQTQ